MYVCMSLAVLTKTPYITERIVNAQPLVILETAQAMQDGVEVDMEHDVLQIYQSKKVPGSISVTP